MTANVQAATQPSQTSRQAQHDGAALGVGHGGIGLPETTGQSAARRLEFDVDALGAGLQGGEEVNLAHIQLVSNRSGKINLSSNVFEVKSAS